MKLIKEIKKLNDSKIEDYLSKIEIIRNRLTEEEKKLEESYLREHMCECLVGQFYDGVAALERIGYERPNKEEMINYLERKIKDDEEETKECWAVLRRGTSNVWEWDRCENTIFSLEKIIKTEKEDLNKIKNKTHAVSYLLKE